VNVASIASPLSRRLLTVLVDGWLPLPHGQGRWLEFSLVD
jgi:hypothetical protein